MEDVRLNKTERGNLMVKFSRNSALQEEVADNPVGRVFEIIDYIRSKCEVNLEPCTDGHEFQENFSFSRTPRCSREGGGLRRDP